MANQPRPSSDCVPMLERHGRTGHIHLATSVPPTLKDHLIEYCEHAGVTMKQAIEEALTAFLYGVPR